MTNGRFLLLAFFATLYGAVISTVGAVVWVFTHTNSGLYVFSIGVVLWVAGVMGFAGNAYRPIRQCALRWSQYTDQEKNEARAEMNEALRELRGPRWFKRGAVTLFTFILDRFAGPVARAHGWQQ